MLSHDSRPWLLPVMAAASRGSAAGEFPPSPTILLPAHRQDRSHRLPDVTNEADLMRSGDVARSPLQQFRIRQQEG